jgi:hypothetical protein
VSELERLVAEIVERLGPAVAEHVAARVSPAVEEPWKVLTVADVAERFSRSERWVRERVRRGDLTPVRLDGAGPGFLLADLQAFAAARRVPGKAS